jgi:hypothetical protein
LLVTGKILLNFVAFFQWQLSVASPQDEQKVIAENVTEEEAILLTEDM